MRGKLDCFGVTDVGCVRPTNQDQFLIADLRKSISIQHSSLGYDDDTEFSGGSRAKLLMVADGMGGHTGGERASWMAVEGIVQYMLNSLHWPIKCERDHELDFFRGLRSSLEYSQDQIRVAGRRSPSQSKMGTTLTLAWVVWPHAYVIHVGDSRVYLCRNGTLELLSHDQTFAQSLIDHGLAKASDASAKRFSHMLTSALGCTESMEPVYGRVLLEMDDKLLLCSDGLTNHVNDLEISNVLVSCNDAKSACHRLVDAAKNDGGRDNITVVVASFTTHEQDDEASEQMMAGDELREGTTRTVTT